MVTHMHQSGDGEGDPDGYFSVNKCMLCIYIFHLGLSNGQRVISPQVRMSCHSELRIEMSIRRHVV